MAETPAAPEVTVRIPGLLDRFTEGQRSVTVRAETVSDSLDRLLEGYPRLQPHLYDGRGRLRTHVKLFHGGTEVAEGETDDVALTAGDEVVVFQAVSGG